MYRTPYPTLRLDGFGFRAEKVGQRLSGFHSNVIPHHIREFVAMTYPLVPKADDLVASAKVVLLI